MEAHSHFGKLGRRRSGQNLGTGRTSLLVALLSAAVAGVLIYLFVSHYHRTTVAPPTTATVFVARRYIPAGTPESSVASGDMLKPEVVPLGQVVPGAIADPSAIADEVSATAIAAGQQVTVGEFSHANVTIGSYLAGAQRAIAISIDPAHGLTTYLARGDTVDVMAQGKSGSFVLFENVTVLGNQSGDVVLDLTDKQTLALANDLGHGFTIWLALRPVTGATDPIPTGYNERF